MQLLATTGGGAEDLFFGTTFKSVAPAITTEKSIRNTEMISGMSLPHRLRLKFVETG